MTNAATRFAPAITTLIRMDHTHVLATFHKYRLDASPRRKQALAELVCDAASIHAQLEEEIFYPAMRSAQPELVDKSLPEHAEMRRLIANLRDMHPADPDYDVTFMGLMRAIIHHVADEETVLLPEAERVLAGRLEELGVAMTRRRFELAKPHAGEIALNTIRSYPAVALTAVALVAVGGFLAWRGAKPRGIDRLVGRRVGKALRHPGKALLPAAAAARRLRGPAQSMLARASGLMRQPQTFLPSLAHAGLPRPSKRWLPRAARQLVA